MLCELSLSNIQQTLILQKTPKMEPNWRLEKSKPSTAMCNIGAKTRKQFLEIIETQPETNVVYTRPGTYWPNKQDMAKEIYRFRIDFQKPPRPKNINGRNIPFANVQCQLNGNKTNKDENFHDTGNTTFAIVVMPCAINLPREQLTEAFRTSYENQVVVEFKPVQN